VYKLFIKIVETINKHKKSISRSGLPFYNDRDSEMLDSLPMKSFINSSVDEWNS
jgi:hypothetical protein